MRQIVSLYVVFSIVFSIFCADKGFAIEVIKQEKLGPEEVLFVEFGLAPEGIYYPKYVISPDQFKVRGPQGQLITSISLIGRANWNVIPSAYGHHFAVNEWDKGLDLSDGIQKTTVYYEDGRVVGTYTWPIYEDGGSVMGLTISDYDGTLALRPDSEEGALLYRPDGRKVPYPPLWVVDFASQVPLMGGIGSRIGNIVVMLVDLEGKPLWEQSQKKVAGSAEFPHFVRLSSKGSFLLAGTIDVDDKKGQGPATCMARLHLFNKAGQLMLSRTFSGDWNFHRHTYESGYVYAVDFSPQERFVGIALTDTLFVVDLVSGQEIYRAVLPNPASGERRTTLQISVNDAGEALVLTGNLYVVEEPNIEDIIDPEVFLFSSSGQLLWKQRFQAPPRSETDQLKAGHGNVRTPENPEWSVRKDWKIELTYQEIYLFFDDTFYRIRK